MIGSWSPIKRQKWQKSLFSPSGTLLLTYSVIWSSLKYIFVHFFDTLVVELLQTPQNHPPGGPTHPDKSANSGSTDPNFEIPSKAHESTQKLLRFMSKPEKIRILTFDPPYRLNQFSSYINHKSQQILSTFMCFRRNFKIWIRWPRICGFVGVGRALERSFLGIWRNSMPEESKKCHKMYFK